MKLTDVSKTAIVTLRSRVLESQKAAPLINDPMAQLCLERLISETSGDDDAQQLFTRKISSTLTRHIALRARKYDAIANDFVAKHPSCLVVNLGCGFDTRYWRLQKKGCEYLELDLPEVIHLKQQLLKDHVCYEMIGISVLDTSWIGRIESTGKKPVLLMAEGVFMYLPKPEVIRLFQTLSERLSQSQIVLEVVTEKYTRGLWKKLIAMKMKRELGCDAGSSYHFGIRQARELESYGKGISVTDEWSFVEDPDLRPRILKYLGISRTQWTVTATIGETA